MNRAIRIQVISTSEKIKYKKICGYLFDLMKEVRTIKNKTIQYLWSLDNKMPLPINEKTKAKSRRGKANSYASDVSSKSYSANTGCATDEAQKRYKNDKKEVFIGEKSIASYKRDQPINIHNESIELSNDNGWHVSLKLFSRPYSKKIGLENCSLPFKMVVKDKSTRVTLECIMSGEYKLTESKLTYDKEKKKWFLLLGYKITAAPANNKYDPSKCRQNVMGVDLGIVYAAYMSFNHCHHRYKIEGNEIECFKKQIERRRKSLQKQRKFCGNGSIGHGRKTRTTPVLKIGDKVDRFRQTTNHKYSKYIVDMARKHQCGTIQMEDLSGIKKNNKFLSNWAYYELQMMVRYKAEAYGIIVVLVSPKYTSQRCSQCGHIDKDNRPTQSEFHCTNCGYKENADYNASQNIATPGIEEIIKEIIGEEET